MGTFKSKKTLNASPAMIEGIAQEIMQTFRAEGFEVEGELSVAGGYYISIRKGNLFKSIVGLKTALKISVTPNYNDVDIEAGIGIFGQQVIPALLMMYVTWPILITQIWGMVKQSNLDDRVIQIAENYVLRNGGTFKGGGVTSNEKFCTSCGTSQPPEANFCAKCGGKI